MNFSLKVIKDGTQSEITASLCVEVRPELSIRYAAVMYSLLLDFI